MGAEGTTGLLSLLIREGILAKGVRLLTYWGEGEGIHGDRSQWRESNRNRFKDGVRNTGVEPRDKGKGGAEKHRVGPRPQDKGKWPMERDFGAQKNPLVTGGDVRTLGGQGTGSSRPALCVSHREWGTWEGQGVGHAGQLPRPPPETLLHF